MRDEILIELGQARSQADRALAKLIEVNECEPLMGKLDFNALRSVRRREGRYLLWTYMAATAPKRCGVTIF